MAPGYVAMKIFLLAFLAALFTSVLSAQGESGTCMAHGQVVSSQGGSPVSDATITIYPVLPPGSSIKVKSTQDGSFSTEFVVSGFYTVNVNHPDFADAEFISTKLKRRRSKIATRCETEFLLELDPPSSLSGSVVDEKGHAVPNAQVELFADSIRDGQKNVVGMGQGRTDQRGNYAITRLASGTYFISVTPPPAASTPTVRGLHDAYATTYYPQATTRSAAGAVWIPAGLSLNNINVTLRKQPTMDLTGHITNRAAKGSVMLFDYRDGRLREGRVDKEGRFSYPDLPLGAYKLEAVGEIGDDVLERTLEITVGATSPTHLTFDLAHEVDLSARIVTLGDGKDLDLSKVKITLLPVSTNTTGFVNGRIPNAFASVKGEAKLRGFAERSYRVSVTGLPKPWFLRDVRTGLSDSQVFEFKAADAMTGGIEIVLSDRGAVIHGVVEDSHRSPVVGAIVVAIPQSGDLKSKFHLHKFIHTGMHGEYLIDGLAPGEYEVVAYQAVEPGYWMIPASTPPSIGKRRILKLGERQSENIAFREGEF